MPDTMLILHVKGTEQETTTLPKKEVRTAISQGRLTHSQLIWSPEENTWKQVRELPHLLPSQKLAPAPVRASGNLPRVTASQPVPRVAGQAAVGAPRVAVKPTVAQPVARAAVQATPKAVMATRPSGKSLKVEEAGGGSHPLKWFSIVLGVLIVAVIGGNYLLVNAPLSSALGKTAYSGVTVYAHLGAYIQPNVVVIHIPPSSKVTSANLTEFLAAVAHSTPDRPMSDNQFDRVALTPGWTARYTLSGYAWKQLGEMGKEDEAQRKEFLLDQLGSAVGEPLIAPSPKEEVLQAEREKAWQDFQAAFTRD